MPSWLITGCSSGFGLEIAKQAISRGDKVAATSRDASKLQELKDLGALTLSLDVNDPDESIQQTVDQVIKEFGKIDILLNNAGYVLEGGIEEAR
jgi:NAD(P)-dependent dehydrogenase (short-subunit alcohol dehydrogenase family)